MFKLTTEEGIKKLEKCIDELEEKLDTLREFVNLFRGGSIFDKKIDHVKRYEEMLYIGMRLSRLSAYCNSSFRNIIRNHFENIYKKDFLVYFMNQPLTKDSLFKPYRGD